MVDRHWYRDPQLAIVWRVSNGEVPGTKFNVFIKAPPPKAGGEMVRRRYKDYQRWGGLLPTSIFHTWQGGCPQELWKSQVTIPDHGPVSQLSSTSCERLAGLPGQDALSWFPSETEGAGPCPGGRIDAHTHMDVSNWTQWGVREKCEVSGEEGTEGPREGWCDQNTCFTCNK